MDSNTASRRNLLAFRISTPINSFRSLSSTVMPGLSSKLRLSGSSEITRWRISSCSKYLMVVLFMHKSPGSQPEPDLLTSDGVDGNRSDVISTYIGWNHHQAPTMTTDHDCSPCLSVKVPLDRMTYDVFKLCQVIAPQRCSVLKVFSPDNIRHMTLTVLVDSASTARGQATVRRAATAPYPNSRACPT